MTPKLGCRFCLANGLLSDAPLAVTEHHFVLASREPLMPMAAMVIPLAHHEDPFTITAMEWADMPAALAAAQEYLAPHAPEGYTLGWNVGPVADQTVPHVHLHVIARHSGDGASDTGLRCFIKDAWAAGVS